MPAADKEFTKLLGSHLLNAKGFYDYGVKNGLTTPEDLRLTVSKRQEAAKALVNGGMSQRKAAKVLGVSHQTIRKDVALKVPKGGTKSATRRKGKQPTETPQPSGCAVDPENPADIAEAGDTPQVIWRRIIDYRTKEAMRFAKESLDEIGNADIDGEVIAVVAAVVEVWSALLAGLKKKER